ncbi:hypothetical protein GCM10022247_36030 [Allokutzneria multivorans]|uniref:DUF397 domain-containing protein n=1 Tax=Allokutzneria multivorans TaxID=1142134 RepID=A0ABP7SEP5_9PSEU
MSTTDSNLDTNFTEWRTSSRSGPPQNQCVQVGWSSNAVGIRDTKDPGGPVLAFAPVRFYAFIDWLRTGTSAPPD